MTQPIKCAQNVYGIAWSIGGCDWWMSGLVAGPSVRVSVTVETPKAAFDDARASGRECCTSHGVGGRVCCTVLVGVVHLRVL